MVKEKVAEATAEVLGQAETVDLDDLAGLDASAVAEGAPEAITETPEHDVHVQVLNRLMSDVRSEDELREMLQAETVEQVARAFLEGTRTLRVTAEVLKEKL